MDKLRSRLTLYGGGFAVGGVCAAFGSDIPFKDQWPLYEALRSTSSIVFAVIGAWITILYPDALKKVFSRHHEFDGSVVKDIELMVSSIRLSTVILASIVAIGIVAQVLKTFPFVLCYVNYLRAVSFGALGFLTYLQFCTLLMTLAQGEIAREKISNEAIRKNAISKFNSNIQFSDKDD